ncbi:MAG TPA: hypothetical protein VF756_04735 [Thermoanaerobaculia bacterium]
MSEILRNRVSRRVAGLLLGLALIAGVFFTLIPGVAEALPPNEIHRYYFDSTGTTIVGTFHLYCDGSRFRTGTTSANYVEEVYSCNPYEV